MAGSISWNSLPSIIIVEILSYLSLIDKLNATSTCIRWRGCLFQPSLWRNIHFKFNSRAQKRGRFLLENCGRFVRDSVVEFNAQFFIYVKDSLELLQTLGQGPNVERLALKPNSFQLSWREGRGISDEKTVDHYVNAIEGILRNSRHLRHLSLGCISELTDHADYLLPMLAKHHSSSLECLHLASVKENPESYGVIYLPPELLSAFVNLQTLSLDYDHINNNLLINLGCNNKAKLQHLILHVHGLDDTQETIKNSAWQALTQATPNLSVTINLIHSFDGSERLMDVLKPAMPLTHFHMYFCGDINLAALTYMAHHMNTRLQSITIVEGMNNNQPNVYDIPHEDPFVMLAWKCANLKHFKLIGYEISSDDLIAIARLRGSHLHSLVVPQCCIYSIAIEDEFYYMTDTMMTEFCAEVSDSLGRPWLPVSDVLLHPAIKDPHADAEAVYLSQLLGAQMF